MMDNNYNNIKLLETTPFCENQKDNEPRNRDNPARFVLGVHPGLRKT